MVKGMTVKFPLPLGENGIGDPSPDLTRYLKRRRPLQEFFLSFITELKHTSVSARTELFELPAIQGGGYPNESAGDDSHHSAFQAFPHRLQRFSAASGHEDRTRRSQSDPAT
jgi:hypothetical protein